MAAQVVAPRRMQHAVHLRHHGLPQGRDADPLQRGQQRQMHRRPHGSFHRGPDDDSGAHVPLLRHGAGHDRCHDPRHHHAAPCPIFPPSPPWPAFIRSTSPASTACPPCLWRMLEHPDFAKTDFSYMRTGIMAGSPCPISKVMRDVVDKMHMSEIVHCLRPDGGLPGLHHEPVHGRPAGGRGWTPWAGPCRTSNARLSTRTPARELPDRVKSANSWPGATTS